MAFKKSTTVFLFVLILAASIPEKVDSKKYKNDHVWQKVKTSSGGGPASWFFPGGRSRSANQETQNRNQKGRPGFGRMWQASAGFDGMCKKDSKLPKTLLGSPDLYTTPGPWIPFKGNPGLGFPLRAWCGV